MSKRPFITQNFSPNIIIVPTVSFCGPPPKKARVESQTKETCEQTPATRNPKYSPESISNNSVQSESSDNKSGDSRQSMQSVSTTERPSPSWASNYLTSIEDSHHPVKLNLSSSRKKIEVLTENSSQNETVQLTALPVLNKKSISIKETKGQQRTNDDSSFNIYKDILTSKLCPGNSSKTEDTYDEIKLKSLTMLSLFNETETAMKNPNTSSDFKSVCKQYLNTETESDKEYKIKIITPSSNSSAPDKYKFIKKYDQNTNNTRSDKKYGDKIIKPITASYVPPRDKYKHIEKYYQNNIKKKSDKQCSDKIITPSTSKYIPIPDKDKYIKYDQNKNETGSEKQYRDKMAPSTSKYIPTPNKYKLIKHDQNTNKYISNRTSNQCNSSCCKTEKNGDKIKSRKPIQSSNHKIVKKPQKTVKEIMQRKNARDMCIESKVFKKHSPIRKKYTTSNLYDKETIKYKEFYTNYKIPKISEKNKKSEETEEAEIIKNNNSTNCRSTKDIFCKESGESIRSAPVKSVVEVVDDPEQKQDTTYDLRSKLTDDCEQNLDTTFDLRSKLSRRSLNHYFTKLRNLSETSDSTQREQRDSLVITVPNDTDDELKATGKRKLEDIKTSKKEEAKTTSPKYKKIKLVIKVICEKSATSSSDTDDEELLGSSDTEQKNVISKSDLSFLDDFNIDEIIESCSKVNAANDFSLNDNTNEINNNKTYDEMLPACLTNTKNERSRFIDNNIIETIDILDKKENIKSVKNENKDITHFGVIEYDINKGFEITEMSHKNLIEDELNSKESLLMNISNKRPEVLEINEIEGIKNFLKTNENLQIMDTVASECHLKRDTLEMNEILYKEAEDEKDVQVERKRDVLETNNEVYFSGLPAKLPQEVRKEDVFEHKQQSKTDNTPFTETTEHISESETENTSRADNESITETTEPQPETINTCQTSITNKKIEISGNESNKESDIIVDLQETDAYVVKRLEQTMKQYLNKKHTISSLLHKGEFSKIYKCVNESGDKYALKVLNEKTKYRNSKIDYLIIKGLQRDVPKANYHCVYLCNGFSFTKQRCVLMELYPKNLKQALQENKKPFHINVIKKLSRQLVSAVTLLRHNNIVHTNIKPTHILVNTANDQLKLCGFDEAQYKNEIRFSQNIKPMNYRAPEVILGHSAGFNMDVWSTALVMYEMATNIQLFPGIFHNDILYKQMFVCGPVPYEMIQQSQYKSDHFCGMTFMRELKGGKRIPVPYCTLRKHDLVKKYVFLTYKNDWRGLRTYKQKQLDYTKLHSFCQLLSKMLVIDPQQRLPIEFVYADPFIFDVSD